MHTELIASIPELIARHAARQPDKAAFTDSRSSVTYAALSLSTANLAGNLQALGVAPGDRVAMLLPNSVQWIQACLAIARAGATSVPISYDSALPEIASGCRIPGVRWSLPPMNRWNASRACFGTRQP